MLGLTEYEAVVIALLLLAAVGVTVVNSMTHKKKSEPFFEYTGKSINDPVFRDRGMPLLPIQEHLSCGAVWRDFAEYYVLVVRVPVQRGYGKRVAYKHGVHPRPAA